VRDSLTEKGTQRRTFTEVQKLRFNCAIAGNALREGHKDMVNADSEFK
jgi:hypothetical protein